MQKVKSYFLIGVVAVSCIAHHRPLLAADGVEQSVAVAAASNVLPPLSDRFASDNASETPDFQRHIGPLLGHLGCNGRACHGSFQGRGGFALSLFGYDFIADHKAMTDEDSGRANPGDVHESLLLYKPIDEERHEGGKRMDVDSWQYRVLARWIAEGAKYDKELHSLDRLEVTPREIVFDGTSGGNATEQLRAVAVWTDGTREDVTQLCRFTTNDDAIALIAANGLVTSKDVGDTHVVVAYDRAVVPVPVIRPSQVDASQVARLADSGHMIDQLVKQKLDKLRITPSQVCTDSDFIRRASLDLIGMLPPAERVEKFLADSSPTKRSDLINELLQHPAYAGWWATRFSDWTGNNEQMLNNYLPVRGIASKLWFGWLQKRLADNMPYDKIVEGIVTAESRLPDESYREYCETMSNICRTGDTETFADRPGLPTFWARSNFRATEDRAVGFAYSFLGVRIQCAQCHKHPFDQWSKDDFDQFSKLFAPIRANQNNVARDGQADMREMLAAITDGKKLNGGELRNAVSKAIADGQVVPFPELTVQPIAPPRVDRNAMDKNKRNRNVDNKPPVPTGRILGESDKVAIQGDPRDALMSWLRSPDNPYFAKAIVNRVWANYFGVGIVDPVDDLNLGNPPSNAALLAYLADGFIESGYNLHWLHREIMTSDAYQRSSEANVTNVGDKRNFSRHVPRRLQAEVLRDSLYLVTASVKVESTARAELKGLAISGNLNPTRRGRGDFALQIFGQSTRESNCDCDRSEQANLLQAIYLQNDIDIHQALRQNGGWVDQVTASWPKSPGNADAMAQRRASMAVAEQRMRTRMEQRVEQMLKMPEARQSQVRQRLKQELEQANVKRAENGFEPLRLAELVQAVRGDKAAEPSEVAPKTEAKRKGVAAEDLESAIKSAYMRTLCRRPDQDELAVAVTFVQESDEPVSGFRSVVWALMNTKEFVLTH